LSEIRIKNRSKRGCELERNEKKFRIARLLESNTTKTKFKMNNEIKSK